MSSIPKVLKDFRVYINGMDGGFNAKSIQLPIIDERIEAMSMGSFKINVSLGLNPLTSLITFYSIDALVLASAGALNNLSGNLITFRGYQEGSRGDIDEIMVLMRGRAIQVAQNQINKGSSADISIQFNILTYSLLINNIPLYVIEPISNTYLIAGINQISKSK